MSTAAPEGGGLVESGSLGRPADHTSYLAHALELAARGWHVFPCGPDKAPLTRHGEKDASADEATICDWWRRWPDAMVGVACGPSGLVVVDVDVKGDKPGPFHLRRLEGAHGELPLTYTVRTPSGGVHYYFQRPELPPGHRIPQAVDRPARGIDVRADTGYIVGAGPGYVVEDTGAELETLPGAWVPLVAREPAPPPAERPAPPVDVDVRELTEALFAIRYDDGMGRDEWLRIGMAFQAGGGAFEVFDAWCQQQPGYNGEKVRREWDSFSPDGGVTARSLFQVARNQGWRPASREPVVTFGVDPPSDAGRTDRIGFVPADDGSDLDPPEYLIHELQEADTVGCTYAEDGVGKTFLMVAKAECIRRGMPFAGRKVQQGPVAMICAEGLRNMRRRHRAWRTVHGVGAAPIYRSIGPAALLDDAQFEGWLDAMLKLDERPIYVPIDTLARNMGAGDENSTADMTKLLACADTIRVELGATVEFQHHPGWGTSERERGASAFFRGLDWRCRLALVSPDTVEMRVKKMKDSELPPPVYFHRRRVTLDLDGTTTSLVFEHQPDYQPPLDDEGWLELLQSAFHHPDMGRRERAKHLGITEQVLRTRAKRVADAGLVRTDTTKGLRLTDEGKEWLDENA